MTDKIILDGREVKVGDRMWSAVSGYGVVTSIYLADDYIICLRADGLGSNNYCSNGAFYKGGPRCLFWSEPKFDPPPPPKRKVKKWQWALKYPGGDRWTLSHYASDYLEISAWTWPVDIIIGPRVDATEIEVEE